MQFFANPFLNMFKIFKYYSFPAFLTVFCLLATSCGGGNSKKKSGNEAVKEVQLSTADRIQQITDEIAGTVPYAELYEERCKLYMLEKKYVEAKADAKNALGLKPGRPYYFFLVAQAHKLLGEADSALIAARTAEEKGYETEELYTLIGRCYLIFRKYNLAIEYFDKALKKSPYYAQAYHYKGLTFAELRDTTKAISTLQTAIEQQPEYADAYNSLVSIYLNRNEMTLAEQTILSALRFSPDDPFSLYNLGLILKRKSMPDSAAFFFRKAVYHKPDFYQAYFNLGMHAYASRNYVEAAEYFEKAQNPNALDEATLYNYGLTLEQLNRLEEANRYFKKVELMRGDLRKQAEQAKIRCENKLKSNSNANKSKANT